MPAKTESMRQDGPAKALEVTGGGKLPREAFAVPGVTPFGGGAEDVGFHGPNDRKTDSLVTNRSFASLSEKSRYRYRQYSSS